MKKMYNIFYGERKFSYFPALQDSIKKLQLVSVTIENKTVNQENIVKVQKHIKWERKRFISTSW